MSVQVKDFMTPSVITAEGKQSIGAIRTLMEREGIHAIPIVSRTGPSPDAETIIQGIITSTDLCKVNDDNIVVEDILSPSVVHVIHGNTGVRSAAKMMLKHKVHHIVVMDDGKIVGMISSLDFVTLIANNALGKKKDRVI